MPAFILAPRLVSSLGTLYACGVQGRCGSDLDTGVGLISSGHGDAGMRDRLLRAMGRMRAKRYKWKRGRRLAQCQAWFVSRAPPRPEAVVVTVSSTVCRDLKNGLGFISQSGTCVYIP